MLKMKKGVFVYLIVTAILRVLSLNYSVEAQFMTSRIRKVPESSSAQKLLKEIMDLELPVTGSFKRTHRDGKASKHFTPSYFPQGRMVSSHMESNNKQQDQSNCEPRTDSPESHNMCCKNQVWVKCNAALNQLEQERKFNRAWDKYSAQSEMRKISSKLDKMLDQLSSQSNEYSFTPIHIKRRSIANRLFSWGTR